MKEWARGLLARQKKVVDRLKDFVHLGTNFGFEMLLLKDGHLSLCSVE